MKSPYRKQKALNKFCLACTTGEGGFICLKLNSAEEKRKK